LLLTILLIGFCLCQAQSQEYPGVVGTIGLDFLNKIKDSYFWGHLMSEVNNLQIDDMHEGKLKFHSIRLETSTPSSDNLQILFDAQNDGLRLIIRNLSAKMTGKWRFKKAFVKIKGHAEIKGEFDEIAITLGFKTQDKEGYKIPAVYAKAVNIEMDKHKWKGSFGHNVINEIGNLILKIFRGKGVKLIRNKVTHELQNKVPDLLNVEIKKAIEIEAPLAPWLSMNIATVSPIKVTADSLSLPLNGTIFIPGSSINTKHNVTDLKLNMTNSKNDVLLTVSNYVFYTFAESLNQYDFEYDLDSDGYQIHIMVPRNKDSISITNTEKGLHVVANGVCTLANLQTSFDVKISGDLSFNFTNGDKDHMFYLNPTIDKESLDISTSNVQFVRQKLGLRLLTPIFDPMIEYFLQKLELKTIPVKKVKDFPFVLNHSSTEFNPSFMSVSLDV